MATAPSVVPLVPRSTSPFVALQPKLNHLPLVQSPPQQTHLNHPSPLHCPPSQPLCLTSSAVISTVASAVASTANFSTSAATKAAAAPIPVPSALKESNNGPFSLSHLSPSTPVCIPKLAEEPMNHPDHQFASNLVHDLQFGCRISYHYSPIYCQICLVFIYAILSESELLLIRLFTEKFSWTSTIHPGIFCGWALWADSISVWMNTIVSSAPSRRISP